MQKKLRPLAVTLLAAAACTAAAQQLGDSAPAYMGSVEKIQFTSITRDTAAIWLRTSLPKGAAPHAPASSAASVPGKQSFTGEITAANVAIPFRAPMVVAVQPGRERTDAVFAMDVKLADLPADLLSKIGTRALDMTVQGTILGEGRAETAVHAVGLLRYGSADIVAPAGAVSDFVQLVDARLTGVSLSETKGEAVLKLYNPFGFAIPIRSVTYELFAGDRRLCGGEHAALRIHPRRESAVRLPITAKNSDLIAAAGSAVLAGGTVDGRLKGAITFRAGKGDITLPISLAAKIELAR